MTGNLLNLDISQINNIGSWRAKLLKKLGISTAGDLLHFFPLEYENWIDIKSLSQVIDGEVCCVKAQVLTEPSVTYIRKNLSIFKLKISDFDMVADIVIFNNKYSAQSLTLGKEYYFYGKFSITARTITLNSPDFVLSEGYKPSLQPRYHCTKGLTNKSIRKFVKSVLNLMERDPKFPEYFSVEQCQVYELCNYKQALKNIHFPDSYRNLASAKRRLAFQELFFLQVGLMYSKNKTACQNNFKILSDSSQEFEKLLPFELTNAQKKAIKHCIDDMKSDNFMARIIQGDVGCGKTAVAASLCFTAYKNNIQVAFMAPTEILAQQHYNYFKKLFSKYEDFSINILTSSTKQKEKNLILSELKENRINLIIGTHALLSEKVQFKNLGLIITDEQHRFGVAQRAKLFNKGNNPHLLVMSATPIPRTLALVIYGDLDISIIDEMPPNRQKVETYRIRSDKLERCYKFLEEEIYKKGHQIYIVCPRIEKSDQEETALNDLISAEDLYDYLKDEKFKNFKLALLHGKMKALEKEQIMLDFKSGEIDILISTTVIEVGVDVPNATVLLIMNAERFGLSQLHQLRGRVGRGKDKSYCILVSDSYSPDSNKRLSVMQKTTDGFKIADEDLKLRGPGDFFGQQQHGLPKLKLANINFDTKILKESNQLAKKILTKDPNLDFPENAMFKSTIKEMFREVGQRLN